ncbi:probable mediator of RNA polymerase II transcription subunit 26b [Cynara cardunculus var. scolymus]|uniref:probable mediator of RNA polymerase II transcription subunit 26b n=1 Tax=Cynara cardunculus var. scolymus TaxID=59895 RepID=UPI000D62EA4D|nr:probable mediator of RNA polymerase II transcription subunit 26b [Cynara cardunculus var. scolymus]XP_024974623.1 probable mediator of RNA polymerase II transcription subunit 26b [Cynara cardunculus var. scolymus]
MAVTKSAARMDYWREFFRTANADIFEIIEGAIMMAASDCPKEFRIRRDGIAQILFSCKLIKCSGCDKEELALPVDDDEHDDDGGGDGGDDDDRLGVKYKSKLTDADGNWSTKGSSKVINDSRNDDDDDYDDNDDDVGVKYKSKLTDVDGNWSKGSSKMINDSRNDDDYDDDNDDDDEDDNHHHHHQQQEDVELNENNHQISNYTYGDAEALTDAMEAESQIFDEVMRIKEIVDNSPDESTSVLCNSLRKLQLMAISVDTLKATEIGKSVNVLRKHALKDVRQIARTLIEVWKGMVDEWVNATTKIAASDDTPESINPSVLDEEDGLPSPPLDDLSFLNPHSMSLELSEFFDGMDDYGNPRKSGEFNKNRNNDGKPPVQKQNVSKWKQQKPSNEQTVIPKEDTDSFLAKQRTFVKPSKPPIANSSLRPNMERKLQNPGNPTLPKRPLAPQHKPRPSDEETVQDKLEVTKRKLQERYQQAENAKRQRTIQVMELHDLPKQGMPLKNQHMRPGNNHNRHWGHGRT